MTKKNILFFTLLVLFVITALITLLGITKIIFVEDKYLFALSTAFLVELAAAVYSWSKNGNLIEDTERRSTQEPIQLRSFLKLQFFGDTRIPHEESAGNVAAWFAYFTPSLSLEQLDEHGNKLDGSFEMQPNWVLVLVFDQPPKYRQATVEFSNPDICPIIDIHSSNSRMIALSTRGQLPAGILTIKTIE